MEKYDVKKTDPFVHLSASEPTLLPGLDLKKFKFKLNLEFQLNLSENAGNNP